MLSKRNIYNKNLMIGVFCSWILVFTAFYYPIGVGLVLLLRVPSTPVNIILRSLPTICSLIIILIFLLKRRATFKQSNEIWFLLLFWIIYAARILYDLSKGVKFANYDNSIIYGITFGNILIPMIAIMFWGKYIKIELINKLLYFFFISCNLIILLVLLTQSSTPFFSLFNYRADIYGTENDMSILNPITIGFNGSVLALTSIYLIMYGKKKIWPIFFLSFLLGIVILMLGASRGPFVAFIISFLILIVHNIFHHKNKSVLFLKYIIVISTIILILSQTLSKVVSYEDFSMLTRIVQFSEDRKANEVEYRDIQYASAWNDFLHSPIIGNQFVGTMDNFYPHNFILELLMATGIIGAIVFMCFFIPFLSILKNIFLAPPNDYVLIALIFIAVLMGNLFSGSLFQSVDFWLLMTFIAIAGKIKK